MNTTEFIKSYYGEDDGFIEHMRKQLDKCSGFNFSNVEDLMIEFASYHVNKALEAASIHVEGCEGVDFNLKDEYPLTNIK